ncbi:MAG: alanine racemase, partial [Burkholderiaceae bacterium]
MSSLLGCGQRPIQLEVSTARLQDNLRALRQIQPNQLVWAVVKARGYGHGLDAVVEGFADADGLALLEIDELRQVRALGWKKPVLLLEGLFNEAGLCEAVELQADLVVHCKEQLHWLLSSSSHPQSYQQGKGRVC